MSSEKIKKINALKYTYYVLLSLSIISTLVGALIFLINCHDVRVFRYRFWWLLIPFLVGLASWVGAFLAKRRQMFLREKRFVYKTLLEKVLSIFLVVFISCWVIISLILPIFRIYDGYDGFENGYYYSYTEDGQGVVLEGSREKSLEKIIIPEKIARKEVVGIGESAFADCTSLKSISIPNSVKDIGKYAFYRCSALTSINLHDNVESVDSYAFEACGALTSIDLGNGLKTLGSGVFRNCTALKVIEIPSSVQSIGEGVFRGCTVEISWGENPSITEINTQVFGGYKGTSITLPSSVINIGSHAFYECENLTSVVLQGGVRNIGKSAFEGCVNLKSMILQDGVTNIGESAFEGCVNLTNVVLPKSVISIGNRAFYNCTALSEITYNAKNCEDLKSSNDIFYKAGQEGEGISVTIGEEVEHIPAYLFRPRKDSSCSPKVTSVSVGVNVTSIGEYAFYDCVDLINLDFNAKNCGDFSSTSCVFSGIGKNGEDLAVNFGDSVEKVPKYMFYSYDNVNLPKITSVSFGENVKSIGSYAFYRCDEMVSASFAENAKLTSIGDSAFRECKSLESVIIRDSVTEIGDYAFHNCTALARVNIGNNLASVGDYIFEGCNNISYNREGNLRYLGNASNLYLYLAKAESYDITSASINENCKFIGSSAFFGCNKLASIHLPKGIKSLGPSAFENCVMLASVTFEDNSQITRIASEVFYCCSGLTEIVLPSSVTAIGTSAFYNCTALTSVSMGENLASIGSYAFYRCTGLTGVSIPSSVTEVGEFAYYGCTALTNVTIPSGVTSIGSSAFASCSGLESVVIGANVTSMGRNVFRYCTALNSIVFEDETAWYRTNNYNEWKNKDGGTEMNVATPSANAGYFTDTYYGSYWYKK